MAADYRPFSTIISGNGGANEGEVAVRPGYHGAADPKNQPMSLELEHKRNIHVSSKSVQKPKKGILKQSSSYVEGQSSQKKQPVHFTGGNNSSLSTTSPYLAMNKNKKQALRTAQTLPERVAAVGLGNSSKKSTLRQDSSKKMIARLGTGDEPPKFSHANTVKSSMIPTKGDLKGSLYDNSSSFGGKKKTLKAPN